MSARAQGSAEAAALRSAGAAAPAASFVQPPTSPTIQNQSRPERAESTDGQFTWRDRSYTIPEVAALLQTAENWSENAAQLFDSMAPGTLAHHLQWSTTQAEAHEQLTSALELADSLPLKLSSPAAQREGVTLVALLQLSGGPLVWRGQRFEAATVAAMLRELGDADAIMVLKALTTRSTALQIERIDAASGRLLTELGRIVADVESICRRHGWLPTNNPVETAGLYRLALEPVETLKGARETLTQRFAGSDHPAMDKLFKAQNAARTELVLLAWASSSPERYKFYTHAECARRRAGVLSARGLELTHALTWFQLERALNAGRPVFHGWGSFLVCWSAVAVGGIVAWPGPTGVAIGLVPGALSFLGRMALAPTHRRALRCILADATWSWRDGAARCRRELRLAGGNLGHEALRKELDAVTGELASLSHVQPAPAPIPPLPRFVGVRMAGVLSWIALLACIGAVGWKLHVETPSLKEFKAAWSRQAKPVPLPAPAPEEEAGEVKVSWPYKPADDPVKLSIRSAQPATAAQIAAASKRGRALVEGYRPETIATPIILPVDAGGDIAVMVFDGRRGEVLNQQLYLLHFRPIPRTWVDLGGREGVYLDH